MAKCNIQGGKLWPRKFVVFAEQPKNIFTRLPAGALFKGGGSWEGLRTPLSKDLWF